jgi:CCR4-NOT transcription complex subunit 3
MSTAARKLQTEIDKTCKKIAEGIEEFHDLLQKYEDTSNQSHKEKLEGELKKEIKKLQRLRDQIKTWQASNEIKDKGQLFEARRSIEAEMERFKVLEKEMKIKAYSKEGLTMSAKLDPKDKERVAISTWINNCVDRLSNEVDQLEAELQVLSSISKKNKKSDENLLALEETIKQHKFHIGKLEAILRSFENDLLGFEDINEIKSDIDYYIECHNDPEFDLNPDVYEGLDLIESKNRSFIEEEKQKSNSTSPPVKKEPPASKFDIPSYSAISQAPIEQEVLRATERSVDVDTQRIAPLPTVTAKLQGPSFASAALMGGKSKSTSISPQIDLEDSQYIASLSNYEPLRAKLKQIKNFDIETGFRYIDKAEVENRSKGSIACSYYPQKSPFCFSNPTFYEKFDMDTLFYIFYFQQKCTSQYLAAQELKRQSWRFHKKYFTWFQRHEEPKIISSDYEHGTYIYFDFEAGWCQRKKAEFTFEYRFLEDSEFI